MAHAVHSEFASMTAALTRNLLGLISERRGRNQSFLAGADLFLNIRFCYSMRPQYEGYFPT